MNTCVALVGAYLRFNGYVTVPEQPVLIGEGRPYRYHTATDVDILAVRFPNAAVVVPRAFGHVDDDLLLAVDPVLDLEKDAVDVLIGEVKSGKPRLNEGLREADVLYATLRRVDPGFDHPLQDTIARLIRDGEAYCEAAGKRWRFRLVAFGEGQATLEGGPFMVIQLRQVAAFLLATMREHHEVWKDAQFGDAVLDLLHLFDKMGFDWALVERASENPPASMTGPNGEVNAAKKTHNQNGSAKKQPKKKAKQEKQPKPEHHENNHNSVDRREPLRVAAKVDGHISLQHTGHREDLERT